MPKFSDSSKLHLEGVHKDLVTLFNYVIQHRDCTVVWGVRTTEQQQALYAKGRTVEGEIVTHADGVEKLSKHQRAIAVDVVPYPEMYNDKDALIAFGNYVKGIAQVLLSSGKITREIAWGGDWSWKDYPHFEIK